MSRFKFVALALFALSGCRCDPPPNGDNVDTGSELPGADVDIDAAADLADSKTDATSPGCGSSEVVETTVAGWTIRFDYDDGRWHALAPGSENPTLSGPPGCEPTSTPVRVMRGEPTVRAAFGNFRIDIEGDDTEWLVPASRRAPTVDATEESMALRYVLGDREEISLQFTEHDGDLRIEALHDLDGAELRFECQPGESFFGLGTQVTGMDLRGRTYPLWSQEQGNSKPESGGAFPLNNFPEAAYAPMGVWHSTHDYSALVTHDGFSELDLCETADQWVALRSYLAPPGMVIVSGNPRERMTRITDYIGRVRSDIPDWTFGLWIDSVTGPERLETVAATLRDQQIPASAIWSEDWIGGSSTAFGFRLSYEWQWDSETYPDLPATIDSLHDRGFAFLGYFNPFVPNTVSTWDEAIASDYLISDEDGEVVTFLDPAFRTASLVNLFDQDARDWLSGHQMTAVTDIGLDGWMADFAEWYPLEAVDPWSVHNLYPLQWQLANDANLADAKQQMGEEGNYVFFPRSGWASVNGGTGGIAPTMWGGDQNTNWEYDDGYPTIVPIGAHVGLSGVAIFGSDIAGYNSVGSIENTDKELWFRWASAAAFHPLMRTHHGGDECENWNFDRDQETLDHTRRWSTVHSMLLPEFRRLLTEATTQGWPITRHPWLVEPDTPALWNGDQYQWFLGDDILVAPVLTETADRRTVQFPEGTWWALFGDDALAKSESRDVEAAVTEVPVFVRGGRALVLLHDAPDTFYGSETPGVTDLDDVAGRYRVALYPDDDGMAVSASEEPFAVGSRQTGELDFAAQASWNGTALPACTPNPMASCLDSATQTVLLVDVSSGSLESGGGTVDIDSPQPVTVRVGIGRAGWGEVAEATSYSPNPDAPSWCPPEE